MLKRWMVLTLACTAFSACLPYRKQLVFGCKDNMINRVSVTPSGITLWRSGEAVQQFSSYKIKRTSSQRNALETYSVIAKDPTAPKNELRTLAGTVTLKGGQAQKAELVIKTVESGGGERETGTLTWRCAEDQIWTEGPE